jgi:hypothetical protein
MNVSQRLILIRPDLCWFRHLTRYDGFREGVRKVGRQGIASIRPSATIFMLLMKAGRSWLLAMVGEGEQLENGRVRVFSSCHPSLCE